MDNYTNHTISTYVNNLSINSYDRQIITNCLVYLLENTNLDDKKLFLKILNYSSIDSDTKSEEFRNSIWKTHNILKTVNIQELYDDIDESPEREYNNYIIDYHAYIKLLIFILILYTFL